MLILLSNAMFIAGETVIPLKRKTHGLKIFHRFHFASALKRMSVIAGHTPPGSSDTDYIATVKGAPETLKSMVSLGCSTRYHLGPYQITRKVNVNVSLSTKLKFKNV